MKKITYLIFSLYFIFFAAIGFYVFRKYLSNPVLFNTNKLDVEEVASASNIYFSKQDTLYRLSTSSKNIPLNIDDTESLLAAGDINGFVIDSTLSQAYFNVKNSSSNWEIWKVSPSDFTGEPYITSGDENLIGYVSFQKPKISPDGKFLAFIGLSTNKDIIFIKNISSNTIKKVALNTDSKIVDFSWNKESNKIVYCTSNLLKNMCYIESLFFTDEIDSFELNVKKIVWQYTEKIIYLSNNDLSHLYSISDSGKENLQIDDVLSPKKISNFCISNDGTKITYDLFYEQKSDIFVSNIDGTNRLQVTTDGHSFGPIFSFENNTIAYLKQQQGIFTNNITFLKEKQILNYSDSIDSLLVWR